jgi:hypothetical protein
MTWGGCARWVQRGVHGVQLPAYVERGVLGGHVSGGSGESTSQGAGREHGPLDLRQGTAAETALSAQTGWSSRHGD